MQNHQVGWVFNAGIATGWAGAALIATERFWLAWLLTMTVLLLIGGYVHKKLPPVRC